MFAPPFGPSDLARRASGVQDDPLIGGTEYPIEASQCGLDEPHDAGKEATHRMRPPAGQLHDRRDSCAVLGSQQNQNTVLLGRAAA